MGDTSFFSEMDELDYEETEWNYHEVLENQNPQIDLAKIKQRIKLAEIDQEQKEQKLQSDYERQIKCGNEMSHVKMLECEIKNLKEKLKMKNDENKKLSLTVSEQKIKIEKTENQSSKSKAEIEVILDAFCLDGASDFQELIEILKFR